MKLHWHSLCLVIDIAVTFRWKLRLVGYRQEVAWSEKASAIWLLDIHFVKASTIRAFLLTVIRVLNTELQFTGRQWWDLDLKPTWMQWSAVEKCKKGLQKMGKWIKKIGINNIKIALAVKVRGMAIYQTPTFQESKCCLNTGCIDYLSRPHTKILWSTQYALAELYPLMLCVLHPSNPSDAYRYVWWSPLWQNCIAISTRKGRSAATPSRDFSEAAHPSSARLSYTVQMEHPKKKSDQNPVQNRTAVHTGNPTKINTVFSPSIFFSFLNQQKQADRRKVDSKRWGKTDGDPR